MKKKFRTIVWTTGLKPLIQTIGLSGIVPRLPRPLAVHIVPRLPGKRGGDQGTQSEWVSEWVGEWEWVRVSEWVWVSEWEREREWESEWVSERVREWESERVSEWVSVSECEWVSVSEWVREEDGRRRKADTELKTKTPHVNVGNYSICIHHRTSQRPLLRMKMQFEPSICLLVLRSGDQLWQPMACKTRSIKSIMAGIPARNFRMAKTNGTIFLRLSVWMKTPNYPKHSKSESTTTINDLSSEARS